MALDGIVISNLVYELNQVLENARISKIAQPETDELLFTCKGPNGQSRLAISASASLPFVYLTQELGISPSRIMSVTFTNKAALEMKNRIRSMIKDGDTSYICTFHGFCVTMLRKEISKLNYPSNFSIMYTEFLCSSPACIVPS